jgi:hypothetical protein
MHKKCKNRLQQRSTRQHRPHSKPHSRSPKSHSPLDQGSTVAAVSSTEGRLPSPAPSAPHATDTDTWPILAMSRDNLAERDSSLGTAVPDHCSEGTAVWGVRMERNLSQRRQGGSGQSVKVAAVGRWGRLMTSPSSR